MLVRTEEVAGLKVYVLMVGGNLEQSYSPLTGTTPLKTVIYSEPGDAVPVLVQEAVNVEFRELSHD